MALDQQRTAGLGQVLTARGPSWARIETKEGLASRLCWPFRSQELDSATLGRLRANVMRSTQQTALPLIPGSFVLSQEHSSEGVHDTRHRNGARNTENIRLTAIILGTILRQTMIVYVHSWARKAS